MPRKWTRLLVVTAVMLFGSLTLAQGAQASLKGIWGTVRDPRTGAPNFPTYHQLGVQVFQQQLSWAAVAPKRPHHPTDPNDPAYHWPVSIGGCCSVGEAVQEAAIYHIRVLLLVKNTPKWANGGRASNWSPNRVSDYTNFLVAAARKFPSVRMWMIWGEPSRSFNWQPLPRNKPTGPRKYARLLDASYSVLKHRNRHNTVIGGNTFTWGDVPPVLWLRYMRLPNGRPPRLDWYGHNPFTPRYPNIHKHTSGRYSRDLSDVDTFSREIARTYHHYRMHAPPLWLSEWTISSDHANRAFRFYVSRQDQARWLTAGYKLVRRLRYVAGLGWFDLTDDPKPSDPPPVSGGPGPTTCVLLICPTQPSSQRTTQATDNGLTTGLMTYNGEHKPAFSAYQHAR